MSEQNKFADRMTLAAIYERHRGPHSCFGVNPRLGPGSQTFGAFTASNGEPFDLGPCDAMVVLRTLADAMGLPPTYDYGDEL